MVLLLFLCSGDRIASGEEWTTERGRDHAVRQRWVEGGEGGGRVATWVRLEPGMHYRDADTGEWRESREEIEITGTGAVARHGPHRAIFSPNVNDAAGTLDLELEPGVRLRSSVLALRYFDPLSGRDAVVAVVRDARGELLPPNQILYRGAFDSVRADVVYTYRKDGMAADVVLREVPPSPAAFGLDPDTARLEVVTEFFEAPEPLKRRRTLATVSEPHLRARVAEPDWVDEALHFGEARIGEGRAFAWSAREAAALRPEAHAVVGKHWVRTGPRRAILIESVEYVRLFDDLLELPGPPARVQTLRAEVRAAAGRSPEARRLAAFERWAAGGLEPAERRGAGLLPERQWAGVTGGFERPMELAAATVREEPGVVVDWTALTASFTDFTFSATNTYLVAGNCWFTGTTVIEGGTVVKFPVHDGTAFHGVTLDGPWEGRTGPYRPAIFTADHDNTVGESIAVGTPGLKTDYGWTPLRFVDRGEPVVVEHFRFKHGAHGVYFQGNNPDNTVRHCQFVNTRYPVVNTAGTPVRLENVLIDGLKTPGVALSGSGTPFTGVHLTVHGMAQLLDGGTLGLTNSLIAGVAVVGSYSGAGNHQAASAAGLFQAVGTGHFYLAPESPLRDAGVAGISPALSGELGGLTTDAPWVLGADIGSSLTLEPQARRDTGMPDIGYHYAPIDYVLSGRHVTHATLGLTDGVVLGVFGSAGLRLGGGARIDSVGMPGVPNRIVYYTAVQEQSTIGWIAPAGEVGLLELAIPDGGPVPDVRFAFTEVSMPAELPARRRLVRQSENGPLRVTSVHSLWAGLDFEARGDHSGTVLVLTNNILEHGRFAVTESASAGQHAVGLVAYNNLFRGGHVALASDRPGSTWVVRDNLFDADTLTAAPGSGSFSHNGFRAGLTAFGSAAVTGLEPDYVATSLGRYAYPSSGGAASLAGLIDAGSRSAGAAGLYHFTTRADGLKEGFTTVDIGFHALDPVDTDGDGIPDWIEDRNGNGLLDPGETLYTESDTDYDGRSDSEELAEGTDPRDVRSVRPGVLARWLFDDPVHPWRTSTGGEPIERTAVSLVPTAPFQHGAELNAPGSVLRYREVEAEGMANINCREGTVQIFLSPYWASAGDGCPPGWGGAGPGEPVSLVAVGDFSIGIDATGTRVSLRSPDGAGGVVTNLEVPLTVCEDDFPPDFAMGIQVSYSTNTSAIFVNGRLMGHGTGIRAWPDAATRAEGIRIGSAGPGVGPLRGIVDAMVTYNAPLHLVTNTPYVASRVTDIRPTALLSWTGVSNALYRIERRSGPDDPWVAVQSARPPWWLDTQLSVGREYEYRFSPDVHVPPEILINTGPDYATVHCGLRLPPDDLPGRVLLVVDGTLTSVPAFAAAVDGLIHDLWLEGWEVARFDGPRHDDGNWLKNVPRIAEVKSWIVAQHAADPVRTRAVLLLGHVPVPYSGMLSPDGHLYRPLPADGYYADVDGVWTDTMHRPLQPGIETPNVAGDGIFDQELIPPNPAGVAAVELAVGRVDFARMPAFAAAVPPRTEVDLLVQYIEKARRHRRGETALPERAMVGAYFSANANEEATSVLRREMDAIGRRLSIGWVGTNDVADLPGDFFVAGTPALWGIQGGFAGGVDWLHSRGAVNAFHGIGSHRTTDLVAEEAEPPVAFSVIEGSWMTHWNDPDHLGRGLLATRSHGLAWFNAGLPRVRWQFQSAALGKSLGDVWRKTQNDAWMWPLISVTFQSGTGTGVRVFTGSRSQGGYIFTSLLGDPTLRPVAAPRSGAVSGTMLSNGTLVLTWQVSPDPGARYSVYRTAQGPGGAWTRVSAAPLTRPAWTDPSPPAGTHSYMVRAMTLSRTASGSYTNAAVGRIWP